MLEIRHQVEAISRGTTFPFSPFFRFIHNLYMDMDSLSLMCVCFMQYICVCGESWVVSPAASMRFRGGTGSL